MVGIAERKTRAQQREPNVEAPPRRLFTVSEYLRMDEAGVFGPEERTELIEGEILRMAPIGSPHAKYPGRATDWFYAHRPEGVLIRGQQSIRLAPRSMPQPDLVIVRYRPDEYESQHPEVADILLLIEISDSSLAYDRGRKLRMYATAGVPEYWIFDVKRKRALAHRKPESGRYTEQFEVGLDGAISPLAFPDLSLALSEIFG